MLMIKDIDALTEKIRKYVKKSVNQTRYEHSVRTAETCVLLCRKYGLDEKVGYLAGIAHDMCKKLPPEKLLEIAKEDGKPISLLEQENPALLHGRAASVMLKKEFNIQDEDVLEAVSNHTFGKKGLCNLGKILYISDKIEPGRGFVDQKYKDSVKNLSLDEFFYKVLSDSCEYLLKKGKKISSETIELLEFLKNNINKGEI